MEDFTVTVEKLNIAHVDSANNQTIASELSLKMRITIKLMHRFKRSQEQFYNFEKIYNS